MKPIDFHGSQISSDKISTAFPNIMPTFPK